VRSNSALSSSRPAADSRLARVGCQQSAGSCEAARDWVLMVKLL